MQVKCVIKNRSKAGCIKAMQNKTYVFGLLTEPDLCLL